MKKSYTSPVLTVKVFESKDVITLSTIYVTTRMEQTPTVLNVDIDEMFD